MSIQKRDRVKGTKTSCEKKRRTISSVVDGNGYLEDDECKRWPKLVE